MTVAADARHAGVDHVANPRHRQRGFGDVGGEHNAPSRMRREHAQLFGHAQTRIQRQNFGVRRMMFAQGFGGFTDLALAAEEH